MIWLGLTESVHFLLLTSTDLSIQVEENLESNKLVNWFE